MTPSLNELEARYRGIFENAVEGIYQSTPDGHYLAVNPALARMYGYESAAELLGQISNIQSEIYVDPSFREIFKREIEQTDLVQGLEYQVRRRDGQVIWISENARAVRGSDGQVCYYEGFVTNIMARKEAEAEQDRLEKQMLKSQKMEAVGTLAGGMAHDFNNILGAMLGYTELALKDPGIKGRTRENLEAVLKSAERAKDLVKRILTFSRSMEPQHHPIKLGAVLQEATKLLNAALPSNIEIRIDLGAGSDVVMADATEMHQVLMNLGTNAGYAMHPKGGLLEYRLEIVHIEGRTAASLALLAGPYVHLTVRDTGCGMSPEVMERVFEPFFTTKPPDRGTGLGLTLVQKIVTGCGGRVTAESKAGAGTTFHVYLPQSQAAPVPLPSEKNPMLPGRNERILIVDDEIPLLNMMQQIFREMGYRVLTRADSTTALETFRAEPDTFDLVITDHTMPGLQGAELAEMMGQIRPNLPVILVTGLNHPPSFANSPYVQSRAVFEKPINFVELSHRIRSLLDAAKKAGPN
jgi:PAS domain S-box-containing protein